MSIFVWLLDSIFHSRDIDPPTVHWLAREMQLKKTQKKRRKNSQFKKHQLKLFRFFGIVEHSIQKVGEILKFFHVDGIHHMVDKEKHILER